MVLSFPLVSTLAWGALAMPAPADAADAAAPMPPEPPALEFRINAGVYLPRLVGTTRLGPSPAAKTLDFRYDIDLNEKKTVPHVEVMFIKDRRWQLMFNGFEYETSRTAVFESFSDYGSLSLAPGDTYRGEFRMGSFAMELSRRQWRFYEDDEDVDFFFSPTIGLRLFDIRQVLEEPGVGREVVKEDYLNAYIGMQMDMHWRARETLRFIERLEINGGLFGGPALGAKRGYGWSVRANLSLFFTENLSFTFGYRLYELEIDDGDYELHGGMQGIFIGGTLRF